MWETPKLRSHRTPLSWDGRRGWPKIYTPTPLHHVLLLQIWYFSDKLTTKGIRLNRKEPPKLGAIGLRPFGDGGMTDHLKTSPLPICYHMKFGSSVSKGVCLNVKEPPKLGSAGTPPAWGGRLSDPLKTSAPQHMYYHIKFEWFCIKGCMHK